MLFYIITLEVMYLSQIKMRIRNKIREWCLCILSMTEDSVAYQATTVHVGDVIWCLMPMTKEALSQVQPGHRIRPFVITRIFENGCNGYACSSQKKNIESDLCTLYICKDTYQLAKSSYANLSKQWFIPYDNMQAFYFRLNNDDKDKLYKADTIKRCKQPTREIGIGTVVKYKDELYLIFQIIKDEMTTFPLYSCKQTNETGWQPFALHKKVYFLNYAKTVTLHEKNLAMCNPVFQLNALKMKTVMQNKQTVLRQKKKEQKNEIRITYEYPCGSIFYDETKTMQFIYLFHRRQRAFGVFPAASDAAHYILRKETLSQLTYLGVVCEKVFLLEILNNVAVNPSDALIIRHLINDIDTNFRKS